MLRVIEYIAELTHTQGYSIWYHGFLFEFYSNIYGRIFNRL